MSTLHLAAACASCSLHQIYGMRPSATPPFAGLAAAGTAGAGTASDSSQASINKVTDEECAAVPHHLLGCITCPDADFTIDDFCREAAAAIKRVLSRGGLPVVAGGSNRYIKALVDGNGGAFRSAHDCFFVWLDAAPEVLRRCTAARVDDMVRRGLVDEARAAFDPDAGYTRGLRRAIGLPEMDAYLRRARHDDEDDDGLLDRAVEEIKANTFGLVQEQVEKIRRLSMLYGWDVRRVDCTEVLARMADGEGVEEPWGKALGGNNF